MDYIARQASLPMEFSRQEYWNGLPFPSPQDFSNPGTEPRSPTLQADSLWSELLEKLRRGREGDQKCIIRKYG